jgi:pimeloyl-ACP methyl ester carboxylesterase
LTTKVQSVNNIKHTKTTPFFPFRSMEAKNEYLEINNAFIRSEWPKDSEEKYIETSFGKTFVRITGSEKLPPLVLMHGKDTNSTSWSVIIKELSTQYCTFAIDGFMGFGLSVFTRKIRKIDDLTNWLDEVCLGLDIKSKFNLMGISYGAWETSQYALRYENKLNKIVLIDPAATLLPLRAEFILRGLPMTLFPIRYFKEMQFSWLLSDWRKKDPSGYGEWFERVILSPKYFERNPNMVIPTVLTDRELQKIRVPTLLLLGENEKVYSAHKAMDRIKKIAPQIERKIIPNAGHDLMRVQKEMVVQTILEFLKRSK